MTTLKQFLEAQMHRLEASLVLDFEERILDRQMKRETKRRARVQLIEKVMMLLPTLFQLAFEWVGMKSSNTSSKFLAEEQLGSLLDSLTEAQLTALVDRFNDAQTAAFFTVYKLYRERKEMREGMIEGNGESDSEKDGEEHFFPWIDALLSALSDEQLTDDFIERFAASLSEPEAVMFRARVDARRAPPGANASATPQ